MKFPGYAKIYYKLTKYKPIKSTLTEAHGGLVGKTEGAVNTDDQLGLWSQGLFVEESVFDISPRKSSIWC